MAVSEVAGFDVGTVDLEWSSEGDDLGPHTHLVGRFFYPSELQPEEGQLYRKPPWLPSYAYAKGYGEFLFKWTKHWSIYVLKPVFRMLSLLLGRTAMNCHLHAPLASGGGVPFPVIIFSHGIGGTRYTYSAVGTRLAAGGFVVFSLEHADGTASTVRLAGGKGHKYYSGWGTEDSRMAQTRYRVAEATTARKLLLALNEGSPLANLHFLGSNLDPATFLKGQLDMDAVALCGHSYGGATVAALGAEDPDFKCILALDPWWGAIPDGNAALKEWKSSSPILIMGSHDWNIPNANGVLKCGGERQERVLRATRHSGSHGGGAVLLVLEGSSHDTFSDVVALFGARYKVLMSKVGFKSVLDPELGLELVMRSLLSFLCLHLPLTPQQRGRLLLHSPAQVRTNESLHSLLPAGAISAEQVVRFPPASSQGTNGASASSVALSNNNNNIITSFQPATRRAVESGGKVEAERGGCVENGVAGPAGHVVADGVVGRKGRVADGGVVQQNGRAISNGPGALDGAARGSCAGPHRGENQGEGVSNEVGVGGVAKDSRVCVQHVAAEEEGFFSGLVAGHVFKLEVAL